MNVVLGDRENLFRRNFLLTEEPVKQLQNARVHDLRNEEFMGNRPWSNWRTMHLANDPITLIDPSPVMQTFCPIAVFSSFPPCADTS